MIMIRGKAEVLFLLSSSFLLSLFQFPTTISAFRTPRSNVQHLSYYQKDHQSFFRYELRSFKILAKLRKESYLLMSNRNNNEGAPSETNNSTTTTTIVTPTSNAKSFLSDFVRKEPINNSSTASSLSSFNEQSLTELNEQLEKELDETKRKYQLYVNQAILSKNTTLTIEEQEFINKIKNREIDLQRKIIEEREELERRRQEIRLAQQPIPQIEQYDNETLEYYQERLEDRNETYIVRNLTIPRPEEVPGLVGQFLKDAYVGPPNPTPRQQDARFVFRSITALSFSFGFAFAALYYFFPGRFVNIGGPIAEVRREELAKVKDYSLQRPQNPYQGKNPANPYENQLELDLNQRLSKYRIFNYDSDEQERTIIKREMQSVIPSAPSTGTTTAPPTTASTVDNEKKILRLREPSANSNEKAPIVMQKVKAVKIEKQSLRPGAASSSNGETLEESSARAPPPSNEEEYIPSIEDYNSRLKRTPLQKSFLQQYLDTLKEDLKDTIDL